MHPCVGITGRARSGKDTAAAALITSGGYVRVGFADALKRSALALDPYVDQGIRLSEAVTSMGWEAAKDQVPEVRRLLQRLGDEAGRRVHGETTWVQIAMREIARHRLAGKSVVVPDVRYDNEVDALRAAGFVIVRVSRAVSTVGDPHPSETLVDQLSVDIEIKNAGQRHELGRNLRAALAAF